MCPNFNTVTTHNFRIILPRKPSRPERLVTLKTERHLDWTLDTTWSFALIKDAMHSYKGIGRLNPTMPWTIRITSTRPKTCSVIRYWICTLYILQRKQPRHFDTWLRKKVIDQEIKQTFTAYEQNCIKLLQFQKLQIFLNPEKLDVFTLNETSNFATVISMDKLHSFPLRFAEMTIHHILTS